jgi:hypothetical protein
MKQILTIQPSNSIIFISGGGEVEFPADQIDPERSLVAASRDGWIVCVLPVVDGETELTFGRSAEVDPGWPPGYVGSVTTPTGELIIDTVEQEVLVRHAVGATMASLHIWFSHPRWPDRVLIGLD